MKAIILAGGSGTRLYPITKAVCKQLLPVYDKPMIYYPLSAVMQAGIKEILVISTPKDMPLIQDVLGDGSRIGLSIEYIVQARPEGIAQALIIGEKFIGSDDVLLILGDNIFFGHGLVEILKNGVAKIEQNGGACIFGYYVKDPERYGVVGFDADKQVTCIEEKPKNPKSNIAVTGLYIYDNRATSFAKKLQPSLRGELEITDLNNAYLQIGALAVETLGRGFAWLDTGTHESLLEASNFIETIEKRQGLKVACLEEISYQLGYIDKKTLLELAKPLEKNEYGQYLIRIAGMYENI